MMRFLSGADRLGHFVGRSGRWIRERETDGVIERTILNGENSRERPVYDADQTLPKLVAFLAARKGPSPEAQALAAHRVEAGRLKLEATRIELDKLNGELMPTIEARRVFSDLVVYFRQRLLHLAGPVKTALGLSGAQTLGLQKEIRAALTELRDQGKRGTGGEADDRRGKKSPAGKVARQKARQSGKR